MALKRTLQPVAAALALAFVATGAFATDGYFAEGYGMKSRGMGGASFATAIDAFGGANNPAGTAFVGNRFDLGLYLFMPDRGAERTGAMAPILKKHANSWGAERRSVMKRWIDDPTTVDEGKLLGWVGEVGKGRFAQALAGSATEAVCPEYIKKALTYVQSAGVGGITRRQLEPASGKRVVQASSVVKGMSGASQMVSRSNTASITVRAARRARLSGRSQ